MSIATTNTSHLTTSSATSKTGGIFQDKPVLSLAVRLNVIELKDSDKQIVNELVYRWCRILTRNKGSLECQVLILDTIGSINPIRLATILKRDTVRMRMVSVTRQCKINSTYVTLRSHIKRDNLSNPPKLFVIFHDEFFIIRTLNLLKEFLQNNKSQVLLVVPKMDRQERDVLNLVSANQILKCDFCVNKRDFGPAPPESTNDSYQVYLNQIYIQKLINRNGPERVTGELREDGLHLHNTAPKSSLPLKASSDTVDGLLPTNKRIKTE